MAKPDDIQSLVSSSYVRMCIYGDPGVGKTPLIGTGDQTLILDADNGTVSAGILGSTAERWRMRDWGDMEEAKDYLRTEGYKEYKWAWLDSATLFQDRGLDHIMQDLVQAKPHRKVYLPDKGEYGQNMNRLLLWLREMVEIPMHIGLTAHTMRTEVETDEGEVETLYMPHIQGKNMPGKVCGEMNIVAYMYTKKKDGEIKRYLRVQHDDLHYAKDRFSALGNDVGVMAAPSIPKLERLISNRLPGARRAAAKKASPVKKATKATKVARKATPTKRSVQR